jgi:hypothetical protein
MHKKVEIVYNEKDIDISFDGYMRDIKETIVEYNPELLVIKQECMDGSDRSYRVTGNAVEILIKVFKEIGLVKEK